MDTILMGVCRGCGATTDAISRKDNELRAKLAHRWILDGLKMAEIPIKDVESIDWGCRCSLPEDK